MTTTVESFFGSGRMVDGFFLNNQMTDFSFVPAGPNAIAPGKRPRSSMTPLVILNRDHSLAGAIAGLVPTPHQLPDRWKHHAHVWHNEVVLAPRLNVKELRSVAREIGRRLQSTTGNAVLMIPTLGTGSYAMPGGPLNDPRADRAYFDALKAAVPASIEIVERPLHAEDPAFVEEAVDRLVSSIEAGRERGKSHKGRKGQKRKARTTAGGRSARRVRA